MQALMHRVLGGAQFGEDEEHASFKFRFLFILLIFGSCTSGIFLLGHIFVAHSMGLVHSKVQAVHVGICLLSMAALYGRKDRFPVVAWAQVGVGFLLFTSALLYVPQDELRILWFFLSLPPVYLLLGGMVGDLAAGLSILILLVLNGRLAAPYSSHALATAVVGFIYLAGCFHAFSSRSISYYVKLVESKRKLRHLSMHDALTGLLNLRAYHQACDQQMAISRRSGAPVSLLFIDLDHFKRVNDTHGHEAGDAVLKAVAACLLREIRDADVVGRIGGEEFTVLLPGTDPAGALKVAEKIRGAIEDLEIPAGDVMLHITASIGVATGSASFPEIQREADQAMYGAKLGGRNRVSTLGTPLDPGPAGFDPEGFAIRNCAQCSLRSQARACPLEKGMLGYAQAHREVQGLLDQLLPHQEDGTRRCAMAQG